MYAVMYDFFVLTQDDHGKSTERCCASGVTILAPHRSETREFQWVEAWKLAPNICESTEAISELVDKTLKIEF
jgi:hypothetical protein